MTIGYSRLEGQGMASSRGKKPFTTGRGEKREKTSTSRGGGKKCN